MPIIAQAYGTPQQLAWNMGVAGITLSLADRHQWSGWFATSVWITVERCEYTTPFGRPVVPEV
jgi:hypothetical protein